jgi:sterol desaturase/sphingolipid hydroxylase (fatty acid hydroxylase superfamily)
MEKYWKIISDSFSGYWNYLVTEISNPHWGNYFYWLIGVSVLFWVVEIVVPWRKKQPIVRKDFWLDAFYMFFNFFIFSLIGYNALSNVAVEAFNDFLGLFGITNLVAIEINTWPVWAQLLTMFVVADFISFNVHRLLHRVPILWEFHKVHHSVEQMGFAAHLRFHWMETIVYSSIRYIPLAMIGFGIQDFFIIHLFALAIGHFNHANITVNLGPLKYLFNNPQMHIWHHARKLPANHKYGVNYGISLSIWDYLFKTDYIPSSGRDIPLGFDKLEEFPKGFLEQELYPWVRRERPEETLSGKGGKMKVV